MRAPTCIATTVIECRAVRRRIPCLPRVLLDGVAAVFCRWALGK